MTEKIQNDISVKDYIEDLFYIKTKTGGLEKLKFNHAQLEFYKKLKEDYGKRPARFIILKARQLGMSTFSEAIITYLATNTANTDAVILAHTSESSSKIYEMTQLYIDSLPSGLTPSQKYSNKKLLSFDNDLGTGLKSSIRVMVAGDSVRGSTFRLAHLSEVAFWEKPEEAMNALNQCVPNTNDSLVIVESTANGFNYFYNQWQDAVNGRSDYVPLFFPWYVDPNYSMKYRGFEKSEYEKDIQERFKLSDDQLQWRRWCIANNCGGDESKFRQEYPITPEEAFITSGASVFDNELILEHMKDLPSPIKQGYFTYDYDGLRIKNIKWVDDSLGYIKIYRNPDGNAVIGGDTSGDGEDYFVGQVLDSNGNQVAVLHHQFDEDLYVKQMYCLGMHYHALLCIEANFSTYPNQELQRLKYPHIYVREKYDRIVKDVQPKLGFKTTSLTRPIIIDQLVEIAREHIEKIVDRETLQEMLSFVKLKGKPQASEGTHDDLVMGLAIAYEAIKQMPHKFKFTEREIPVREEVKSEDLNFFEFGM